MDRLRLNIKNQQGKTLGLIEFGPDNEVQFIGDFDQDFHNFALKSQKQGITQIRDIYDAKKRTLTMVAEPIRQIDPNFPLVFKQFLERSGYAVTEKHPEVEEEIKKFLAAFPDDNPDKTDILKRLSEMSYLEQTAILEGLKGLPK